MPVEEIDVNAQPEQREEMIRRSGRRTVPQIFIGERHIGGCDDLHALDAAGGWISCSRCPPIHSPKVPKMANEQTPITTDQALPSAQQLVLQGVYLKDCSFEAPRDRAPTANGTPRSPST